MTEIKVIPLKTTQKRDNVDVDVRVTHVQNNDNIRELKTDLYDVDQAILWHLQNVVRFKVNKKGIMVNVPVMYASPEKWTSVQKYGYLRDSGDKLMIPLVALNRTGVDYRDDYRKNEVVKSEDNRWIFEKKYSTKNIYNRFDLVNNITTDKEFYSVDIPRFVTLQYQLICWADYVENINNMIEQLIFFNGTAFGDQRKFTVMIDSPSIDLSNQVGEDHFVRATFTLRVKAYILNSDNRNRPTIQKLIPPNKVVLNFKEKDSTEVMRIQTNASSKTTSISLPGSTVVTPTIQVDNNIVTYINTNIGKYGVVTAPNIVSINNASLLLAPAPLPPTTKNSFYYFINGQQIPSQYVISLDNSTVNLIVTFDIVALGYELEESDVVYMIGKFSS